MTYQSFKGLLDICNEKLSRAKNDPEVNMHVDNDITLVLTTLQTIDFIAKTEGVEQNYED